jgi:dihydroxyacetone synthase
MTISIETWAATGWERFAHAGCHMSTFGLSGPYRLIYEHFGFTPEFICKKIEAFMAKYENSLPCIGEFEDLLYEHQQYVSPHPFDALFN